MRRRSDVSMRREDAYRTAVFTAPFLTSLPRFVEGLGMRAHEGIFTAPGGKRGEIEVI